MGAKYVTGIRFIQLDGIAVELGHILKHKETYISVKRSVDSAVDSSCLQGFQLAVGQRGIQGIAMVLESGELCAWAGTYEGLPRRRLLARDQPIQKLQGHFDVSRL